MTKFIDIERIDCRGRELDIAELRARREPVILSGAIYHWPAIANWSFDYISSKCGGEVFTAEVDLPEDVPINHSLADYQFDIRLDEFLRKLEMSNDGRASYISNKSVDRFPGLVDDLQFDDLLKEHTEPEMTRLWIGSGGTKSSLHFDYYENVLTQIVGSKKVYLVDPKFTGCLYQYSSNIDKSQIDVETPDLAAHPKFDRVSVHEGMLERGECLLIPPRWWHAVRSLSPSISVNCFYGPRLGEKELVPMMLAGGPRLVAAFFKDFFWSGLFGRPYKKRLYAAEPFGVWFYTQLRASLARRTRAIFRS